MSKKCNIKSIQGTWGSIRPVEKFLKQMGLQVFFDRERQSVDQMWFDSLLHHHT